MDQSLWLRGVNRTVSNQITIDKVDALEDQE